MQQPANAPEAAASQAVFAGAEIPASPAVCKDCGVIESKSEADIHGEGVGLAALGALLAFAGFKVMKVVGAIQYGWQRIFLTGTQLAGQAQRWVSAPKRVCRKTSF